MANIILVHGMSANEKSWFGIPSKLIESGHNVAVVRLPGHGALTNNTSAGSSITLADYVMQVKGDMSAGGEYFLVGHSMGGMVISQAASNFPNRVKGLIYVAAMLPQSDESISDIMIRTGAGANRIIAEFNSIGIDNVLSALSSQPQGPLDDVFVESAGFDSIPRYFVRCSDDRIIPPPLQDQMISSRPGTEVLDIATGHIPQVTAETELLQILTEIVA